MLGTICCCRVFAIVIYNSNALVDDNFKILLNSTDIGHIDNNSNTITGRIFTDTSHVAGFTPTDIFFPDPNNFEATVTLDLTLLINGSNALQIESIQNNASGNAGRVQVGYWIKDGSGKYVFQSPPLLDTTYGFGSGVGNGQDYTFTWP